MVRQKEPLGSSQRALRYAIIDTVPQPLVVLDEQLRVFMANKAFYESFQASIEDTVGQSLFQLGGSEWDILPLRQLLTEILSQDKVVENFEVEHEFPSLGRKVMLLDARAGHGEDGDGRFIVISFRDVTEAKQSDQRMKRLNASLQQYADEVAAANKELEAFSYSVSHDLRAPLRSLDGFSLALLEDYSDKLDDEGKDYLRRMRMAATNMATLIDDLLQLSRLSRTALAFTTVDLSSLVRHAIYDLRAANPERVVDVDIPPDIKVVGDRKLLQIAMINLVGNAWKFTSKTEGAHITFGQTEQDGKRVYFISDNGAGFDMQYADKLLQPFIRLHAASEFPGSGIGLAIVQRIIHRHRGRLWAEGYVNKGATFYFTLGIIESGTDIHERTASHD